MEKESKAFNAGWLARDLAGNNLYKSRESATTKYIKSLGEQGLKIIFLDIDGVLNNVIDSEHHPFEYPDHRKDYLLYSKKCVELLNQLTETSGAKIVVSSTWRLGETDESMKAVLSGMGIKGEYLGMTGQEARVNDYTFRGNEILSWIKRNEVLCGSYYNFRSYVILDDDSDMLLWQKDNYVNCDPEVGMTHRTLYKALTILNNAPCVDVGQEHT